MIFGTPWMKEAYNVLGTYHVSIDLYAYKYTDAGVVRKIRCKDTREVLGYDITPYNPDGSEDKTAIIIYSITV